MIGAKIYNAFAAGKKIVFNTTGQSLDLDTMKLTDSISGNTIQIMPPTVDLVNGKGYITINSSTGNVDSLENGFNQEIEFISNNPNQNIYYISKRAGTSAGDWALLYSVSLNLIRFLYYSTAGVARTVDSNIAPVEGVRYRIIVSIESNIVTLNINGTTFTQSFFTPSGQNSTTAIRLGLYSTFFGGFKLNHYISRISKIYCSFISGSAVYDNLRGITSISNYYPGVNDYNAKGTSSAYKYGGYVMVQYINDSTLAAKIICKDGLASPPTITNWTYLFEVNSSNEQIYFNDKFYFDYNAELAAYDKDSLLFNGATPIILIPAMINSFNRNYIKCTDVLESTLFAGIKDIILYRVGSSRFTEILTDGLFSLVNSFVPKLNEYKGQMHFHTNVSGDDGFYTPTEIMTKYKDAGYDFAGISAHDTIVPNPGVAGITFMKNIEETQVDMGHILVFGEDTNNTDQFAQSVLNDAYNKGLYSVLAHPYWGGNPFTLGELLILLRYQGVEVYNAAMPPQGYQPNAEDKIDACLTYGKRIHLVASDDYHRDSTTPLFAYTSIQVNADTSTELDIFTNIKNGNYYASTGADLSISVTDRTITATTSNSSTIEFIGKNGTVLKRFNSSLTGIYIVSGLELYVRIRITRDSDGRQAWSNPIYIDVN